MGISFEPEKWGRSVEHYFGAWWGRRLMQVTIICVLLAIISAALFVFFDKFIGGMAWPFFVRLFGGTTTGISLDNIEAIILVLTLAIGVLVVILAIVVYVFVGTIRRRAAPQGVIDTAAEFRSKGISILNKTVVGTESLTDQERDDYVEFVWRPAWQEWATQVTHYLGEKFTRAEQLSFSRLGVIAEVRFGIALNGRHGHYLMQLSKQLTTLENLIERHQERR